MEPEKVNLIEGALFSGFAAIGGVLAYLMRTLNKEEKPIWSRAIVEFLSSGFVGVLAALACKAAGIDYLWSGVIVGVFGWMGAEASIAMLGRIVRKRLGIDVNGNSNNS